MLTTGSQWYLPLMRKETPGMGKVNAKFLPSVLVLVRLVAVKGDESPILDPKGELESPRKQEASGVWLYPSNPSSLHPCTPQIQE